MIIEKFSTYRRAVVSVLLPLLLCLAVRVEAFARDAEPPEGGRVTNVHWMARGGVVYINYDLAGPEENEYDVSLVLRLKSDTAFRALPASVEGHIGLGQSAGEDKSIRWYMGRDFPQGLSNDEYFFEVNATLFKKPSSALYYYIIGGTALAAAGVIALIAGRSQATVPVTRELPYPPARP